MISIAGRGWAPWFELVDDGHYGEDQREPVLAWAAAGDAFDPVEPMDVQCLGRVDQWEQLSH